MFSFLKSARKDRPEQEAREGSRRRRRSLSLPQSLVQVGPDGVQEVWGGHVVLVQLAAVKRRRWEQRESKSKLQTPNHEPKTWTTHIQQSSPKPLHINITARNGTWYYAPYLQRISLITYNYIHLYHEIKIYI